MMCLIRRSESFAVSEIGYTNKLYKGFTIAIFRENLMKQVVDYSATKAIAASNSDTCFVGEKNCIAITLITASDKDPSFD
ncbi:MAG: hypothetical protein RMX65_012005 [Nostoc sp. DedQUE01]